MSAQPLSASLDRDEAVLRFPFDERLRVLLRAIPGRRWDPAERAWRIPLAPDSAESLACLLANLHGSADIATPLARRLTRLRARRARGVCFVDLARPDEDWWLSFCLDPPSETALVLLAHPLARRVEPIGRALVPPDALAAQIVAALRAQGETLALSAAAARALERVGERPSGEDAGDAGGRLRGGSARDAPEMECEVEFRRDRRAGHWILIAPEHAAGAREAAERVGLDPRSGPGGTVGLAALEHDAEQIAEVLGALDGARIERRVDAWLWRALSWRGNIEVDGAGSEPSFLLLGDPARLPRELSAHARAAPGGATVPLTLECWRLICERLDGWSSPAARRCAAALEEGRPAPPAVLEVSTVHRQPTFVLAPGHDPALLARFAGLSGALEPLGGPDAAREHARLPAIRADPFCVPELDDLLARSGAWVAPDALEQLQEIREEHARAEGLVALSAAHDAELEVDGLRGELKPFQRAGVTYALSQRRCFLADEQGLGKTIQALAALQADDAFPAIVLCPASLKLNWLREIERWLPGRSVQVLRGNGRGAPIPAVDLTVANYDIVSARLHELAAIEPRALVLDESHHCKNPSAKRTQAAQRLAASVGPDGLVLALTGTPVVNRPAELVSQLRIIGRLEDFGSGARFGERFQGPDAHMRLHWHLRARCFARRLKVDVLPQLPPKTRAIVPVELDNEPEYRLAERDLVAWLQTQPLDLRELDARVAAALRAERLVRLNALKLLAARGKLHAALTWIHDFCATGERLVVFARHRAVLDAVVARFPAALHVLGSDSHAARDAAVGSFQQADSAGNQLIACSIEVAGQGITLTRASNVVFLELDWTPARHDQAEDRCHRIGQRDAVSATYLLAAGTVDETIAELLERKRAVIGAVTDGREQDEEAVLDALVRELRGAPYRHLRSVA